MRKAGKYLKKAFLSLHRDEAGQGMTEYIIIVVLIAIAVILIVMVASYGTPYISAMFGQSTEELESIDVAPTEDY